MGVKLKIENFRKDRGCGGMVLSVRDFHFYKNLAKRPLVTLPVGLSGLSVPVAHTQEAPAPVNNLSATGSVQ